MINGHRVIDLFPFFNELDLLGLRLRTLDGLVDQHLAFQSRETHAGTPKPLYLDPADARWQEWSGRLQTALVPNVVNATSRWDREHAPREAMAGVLDVHGAPDDFVIYSDADEIPDPKAIRWMSRLVTDEAWVGFRPKLHAYYLDLRTPQSWSAIALCRVSTFCRLGGVAIREARKHPPIGVPKGYGGWHFSYLGGPEAIQQKLSAFAHDEFDTPANKDTAHIADAIRHGVDVLGNRGWTASRCGLNDLPPDVKAHPERYAHLLSPEAL